MKKEHLNVGRLTLTCPLTVTIPRRTRENKVFILNLNHYRNTHHMTLNQAKVVFKELMEVEAVFVINSGELPPEPYRFTYRVFPASNRSFDLGNVCSIVQKFTDDALVEMGVIKDDNFKILREVNYRFGCVDKDSPRVELTITTAEGD